MTESDEPIDPIEAELDRALEESEAAYLEVVRHNAIVDDLFDWLEFAEKIQAAIEGFQIRVSRIPLLLAVMTEEADWHFLRGSQYCAVMGAYERFVHEVFELMIFRDDHFEMVRNVLANDWPKNDKHQQHVVLSGLKKKTIETMSRVELAEVFRNTTLNDATRIASSVEKLFDLKFPVPQRFEKVCAIRNVFTHNAGVLADGELQPLSRADVCQLIKEIDDLVAIYAKALEHKAEVATGI
ncbi:hypothetical protein C4K22_4857 [Pseudomonas chlororaphis subsp. aurantiaca]|uniref:RiboL-PSP-HEPN domain-containing protein n=1 Tax=Pseudomonas chlororaphis subsp. aurantiaca TaxID=86192 RepID=A0AAJ1E8N0_9PSED|nr:hypothetical protein [Pseudomonas chlororaphis]AZD37578.1 hypothetical protein C4K22_4857 [Pseudomonas chlororaphis subsp. aurantiaca]AZD43917.1 hypothetical protein C4K21_4865 [Pseudomonas chlororaphis subsp. aurantiaca]AZD56475.1 hypothetical protein C4K19_4710 [Pseudomonas chlororaphis subsp. aurantiaca]AZD62472.1 hypothetical protein C4K18_4521 [Pseudomonas chlororaphis subsp. aurantiaca]MBU4633606.1 hypothetical protein [Pseudomonas chlororaphis subsp. aurantiaca]